jgi:bilirubin oxidase
LIAPAERADVIVDFTGMAAGTQVYLINSDGDPATTGQVMKFVVGPLASQDTSTPALQLDLPAFVPLGPADNVRQVSLNLTEHHLLGTVGPGPTAIPMMWGDEVSESPLLNATEVWEIFNFSPASHPVHLHMVQFEIINRENMTTGAVTGPRPGETGEKDTVIASNGEITRVKARFDIPGQFVWHCHILEHEDNEMMRPYRVISTGATGDVNGDGQVTVADALLVLQAVVGNIPVTPALLQQGDVAPLGAPDGVLTVADALLILRKAIGIIVF